MITFENQIDYEKIYKDLAGGGLPLKFYRRIPSQRGYGLFSLVRRFAFPILKHLGKQALPIGTELLNDILPGVKQAKENLKKRAVSALHSLGDKVQKGIGRRRYKKRKSVEGMRKKRTRKTRKSKTRKVIIGGGRRKKTSKKTKKRRTRKTLKSFDIFK